jgi:flagellar biosynthesis/type III secretory pathway protein FliH
LEFPIVKLIDYADKWEELEQSDSPFAIVVMAHLKTMETSKDSRKRLEWKLNLVTMLYESGYSERDVRELFQFIDWIMKLPKALEDDFKDQVHEIEEAKKMPYMTSIERLGREEGFQQGELAQKQKMLQRLINRKFGLAEQEKELISRQFDPDLLDKALDEFVFASSKEEVLKHLR